MLRWSHLSASARTPGFRVALLVAVASAALASAEPVVLRSSIKQGAEAAAVAMGLVNQAAGAAESDPFAGWSQWSGWCGDAYRVCSPQFCYRSPRCIVYRDATAADIDAPRTRRSMQQP